MHRCAARCRRRRPPAPPCRRTRMMPCRARTPMGRHRAETATKFCIDCGASLPPSPSSARSAARRRADAHMALLPPRSSRALGREWIVEAYGCDPERLADPASLRALFDAIIARARAASRGTGAVAPVPRARSASPAWSARGVAPHRAHVSRTRVGVHQPVLLHPASPRGPGRRGCTSCSAPRGALRRSARLRAAGHRPPVTPRDRSAGARSRLPELRCARAVPLGAGGADHLPVLPQIRARAPRPQPRACRAAGGLSPSPVAHSDRHRRALARQHVRRGRAAHVRVGARALERVALPA
jgi:hypothetical protein